MTEWTKAGNDELAAFDQLMLRYQRQVVSTALRLLGNIDDAKDVAQEVFLRLYKNRHQVEQLEPGAWLYRVTVNACFDLRRKRVEMPLADGVEPEPSKPVAEEAMDLDRRREVMKRALRRLPDRERAAVVLREVEGLSTAEVAAALGVNEVTVRSQISTAKSKLRKIVAGLMEARK